MKWGALTVLATIWAVGCGERETRVEDADGRRVTHHEGSAISEEAGSAALWNTQEEFLRLIEFCDDEQRSRIVEALEKEFVEFAADFEDVDAAVVEFAKVSIEGAEEGPERDRILDHLLEGAFPDRAYRGMLQVVLDYYSFPSSKRGRIGDVAEIAFEIDPVWVFSTADSLEEPEYRDMAYWEATRAICEKCASLREAIEMARGFTGDEMPSEVLTTIGGFADEWENSKPENLGETLEEILGSITVTQATRDDFVTTILRTWSDHNLAETVAVFQNLDVRGRGAWQAAAMDAPEVTLDNARLFLEAIPESASAVTDTLLNSLEDGVGAEEVFELVAGLPAERRGWAVPYAIFDYAEEIGVSEALEIVRERLSPSVYRRSVERLEGYSGHLSESDREVVEAALEEVKSHEPPSDDE